MAYTDTSKGNTAAGNGAKSRLSTDTMPALDWIHAIFLFYSGAHNAINAWHRAENGMFFIFVLVGILSVELMLWSIYKYWKAGQLIGKMERVALRAGALAFAYATLGILAQAQSGGGGQFLEFYYAWILPSSAPMMFLFTFLIQAANPVDKAVRDQKAYSALFKVEQQRETLDRRRTALDQKRQQRMLEVNLFRQEMGAKWKEASSGRVRRAFASAARVSIPKLLARMGVKVGDTEQKGILARWRYTTPVKSKSEVKKLAQSGAKNGAAKNGATSLT